MVPIIPKQRLNRPNASKRFNELIEYLQGEREHARQAQQDGLLPERESPAASSVTAQGGQRAEPSEFSEILSYATAPVDTKVPGEKCVAIRTHGVSSIETASAEMNAVSRKNTRCLDPVYHFILSWPEHEKPTSEAIFGAAEHAIRALGFQEHQYVLAVHANTDNIHCHVAVNRVHPTTFKSHHIEWAKRTLHYAARESEIEHGWSHDNGIYVVEIDGHGRKQIVLNPRHAESSKDQGLHAHPEIERDDSRPTWHDPESLDTWLKKTVASAIKADLPGLTSWQALHVWLEGFGITLKDAGGGGMRLRAVSPETGEILEVPVSTTLRRLKRPELEKRWGAFKGPFTIAVNVPDLSHLTAKQIHQGVNRVLRTSPDRGVPPPDHVTGPLEHPRGPDDSGSLSQGTSGLHAVPASGLADGGEVPSVPLQNSVQAGLGDGKAGKDQIVRHALPAGAQRGGLGNSEERAAARGPETGVTTQAVAAGRKLRDPEARARRKAERAAGRADLRQRFAQYRNFVSAGDTEYFQKLKALREHRSRDRKEIRDVAKAARRAISPTIDREVRLISLVAIDVEATRRRLAVDAKWQERQNALRATRVPPLPWREWLYEQANRGDKAALSALRGIVYQAQRDAKLPQRGEDDLDDLEASAADYRELQHKRLMARLLIEERKEAAIRASSVYAMRPHEVDSLILSYAGLQWRVTGNGNVEYSRNDGQHLFTDRGNRLTFDRMRVTDNEIQLALVHACEKFGRQLTLTGDDPIFVTRMVCLADDMGLAILNPDLQPAVVAHRAAKKLQAGRAAEEAARRDLLASSGASRPRDSDERAKAGPTAATPVPQGSKPDEVSTDVLEAMLNQLQPSKPTIPAPGQDRLRALVLAIDPRAKFEEVHASNEARLYVGPIAAVLDGDEPMFAQHLGRGIYAIHRQLFTEPHDGQSAEIRYRAGAIQVGVSRHGPDREV